MLEDYLAPQPTAIWNTVRGVWEKPQTANLFCAHLELFSEVWLTSGTMRDGQVYELPMQERLTTGSESLSSPILPTPAVAHLRNHDEDIDGYLERRQDFLDGKTKGMPGASLGVAVRMQQGGVDYLPTPTTRDFKDGQAEHERDGVVQTDTVARAIFNSGEVSDISWGKFEPAIRRWEQVLGRPAPAPTKPDGKDGAHRLSSLFTEWLMGLPEGWITGHGLTRNDELKMAGNGVVPQQAELALRILLDGLPLAERERESNASDTDR